MSAPKKKVAPKKRRKKSLVITCEILPPGSLKRKGSDPKIDPLDRWEDIVDICAEVIAEKCR